MNANTKVQPQILWTFNFVGEGFNQVYASNRQEAVLKAKAEFPTLANKIDAKSFRAIRSQKAQNEYYASFPLMD